MCRAQLIHEGAAGERSLLGEIAHIVGEKTGAARWTSPLTVAQRADPSNLMLLCQQHHKIIDDNPELYPIDRLRQIRQAHLEWLAASLEAPEAWSLEVSAFTYLNVPRLSEYAALNGFRVNAPNLPEGTALHDLGYELNRVMSSFRQTLENMSISNVSATRIGFAHEGYIGQLLGFDRLTFRTKNVPSNTSLGTKRTFTGDLSQDPHVYHRFPEWTLVLNINERWITTDTAFGLFRPSGGIVSFTGFGRVTSVDLENLTMTCTALAIGLPKAKFDLFDRAPRRDKQNPLDFDKLTDAASIARGTVWSGSIDHCDFCGRDMTLEEYMVDGPMIADGPWGCMCGLCYNKARLPLGPGKGQLYEKKHTDWVLVGGYPLKDREL